MIIAELEDEMQEAASKLEFERAAVLRDQINSLKSGDFKPRSPPAPPAGRKRGGGTARPRRKNL
jgi:excinuclease ABC subunit B